MRLGLVTLLAGALLAGAALLAPAAGAGTVPAQGFAFGRLGGNIMPFTVTIAAGGRVHAQGPVHVGRRTLTHAQLVALAKLAAQVRFSTLPPTTNCPGTLPDVSATFVRVGVRTVRVHGDCVSRFTRIWNALSAAVKLTY
jgi:hypothetical protein